MRRKGRGESIALGRTGGSKTKESKGDGLSFPAAVAQIGFAPSDKRSKRDGGMVYLDISGLQFFTGPGVAWRTSMSS